MALPTDVLLSLPFDDANDIPCIVAVPADADAVTHFLLCRVIFGHTEKYSFCFGLM